MVNLVAPYRIPVYEAIGEAFDTAILYSGSESNRTTWGETLQKLQHCRPKKSWGFTITIRRGKKDKVYHYRYLHLTPGYLWDLFRERPAAVIGDEMGFRTLAALIYGMVMRKPVWVWWGGTIHNARDIGRLKRVLRKVISRWAKRWISYGQSSTEYLLRLGVQRESILQIQNCVDERIFQRDVQPALELEPKPVLLHVGHLTQLKGVDLLVNAAAKLQGEGKQFSLLFVGSGPLQESLMKQVEDLGLKHVVFNKPRKPEEMPEMYRSADALIFATLDDVWGLVANEALWCGVPVLSSIYAGCTNEIIPESNRFDPLDESSFVEGLRKAIEGRLSPADTSVLKLSREIGQTIVDDIRKVVNV